MDDSFQEILDLVLKASNEGIWDWNIGSKEIYYSERVLDFFGYSEEEAPNLLYSPESILLAEDVAYFRNMLDLVLMDDAEELFAVDCRLVRKDKVTRWIRVRGVVVREGGEALRIAGSMIDITKRKRAEASLEEEREMLRLIIDNVPVQVYFKDLDSRFTMVNKRQAHWLGCESENQILGKSDADFYAEEGWRRSREDERKLMETGKPILGEIQREKWVDRPDTYVQVVKQAWYDSRGRLSGTFGFSTDVTMIFDAKEKLEEVALDLQARNKLYQEELGLAREVQQALLPESDEGWKERLASVADKAAIEVKYIPATELAGDYYDVLPISDQVFGLFICDVMGHGVRSALVVSMIRGLMEKASAYVEQPALYLQKINEGLCRILGPTGVDMFATACYVTVNFNEGVVRVASAGHDDPLIFAKKGHDLPASESSSGPALGFFNKAEYHECTYALEYVSELVLYTDGIYESANKAGEEWSKKRLEDAAKNAVESSEGSTLEILCDEAIQWVRGKGFDDDVCLLSCKFK
ncbi:SpoIIE family protein phosphatase [Rubritalea spongiae]|uniref:SpoIIE family protein phosphatase n=1 Tax=Rubritalea spongiae TaxID=430797 RepID=A0ABW5E1N3_9BACT